MDHDAIQEYLGAFSLNAVDEDEAAVVAEHLTGCPSCRREVDRHLEVAGMLSATERFAPADTWQAIAGEIRKPPERPAPEMPSFGGLAEVIPVTRRWLRPLAAAAVFVLLAGTAIVQSIRLDGVSDDLAVERAAVSALTDQLARPALDVAAADAMSDPAAQRVSLSGEESAQGAIIVLMPDGTGYLAEHTLQPLPANRTYQLWAIVDGKVISAGVLGSDPGVVPFHIDPSGFQGFAITEEVVGGVEASENQPVVVGLAA